MARLEKHTLSANEAACVTGVPLKQVHRIIDAGLLGKAVRTRNGTRAILDTALVGLMLAHETNGILTLEGRRRLICRLLEDPDAKVVREDAVSVDVRPMKSGVQRGLTTLQKAKKMIVTYKDILGGAPCFKRTRIAVHDIVEMVSNCDDAAAILAAYPMLTEEQVDAAIVYVEAYPRRGRPRREAASRAKKPTASHEVAFDELPRVP